jgi:hypothetical protein
MTGSAISLHDFIDTFSKRIPYIHPAAEFTIYQWFAFARPAARGVAETPVEDDLDIPSALRRVPHKLGATTDQLEGMKSESKAKAPITPPPATHDAGGDGDESESEPEVRPTPASAVPAGGVVSLTLTWERQEDKSYKAAASPGFFRIEVAPPNPNHNDWPRKTHKIFFSDGGPEKKLESATSLKQAKARAGAYWLKIKTKEDAELKKAKLNGMKLNKKIAAAAAKNTEAKAKAKAKKAEKDKERRAAKKIAAAAKTAELQKTVEPESEVPFDGITWRPRPDGGCEGFTADTDGAWSIMPTIEGDRHFAAYHPQGVMIHIDRKEIGTFLKIEEAQAACEADRVAYFSE